MVLFVPHRVFRFILFLVSSFLHSSLTLDLRGFLILPILSKGDLFNAFNYPNLSKGDLSNFPSLPNHSMGDLFNLTNQPNLSMSDLRNLPKQANLYMGDLPYPPSFPMTDLTNLTNTLALNLSEASNSYFVDPATGAIVHTSTLYADIFISCLVFFLLLLTMSFVVVQCRRTPRIPHDEFLLIPLGPVPGAMTIVPSNNVPPPSYGTYTSPSCGTYTSPSCGTYTSPYSSDNRSPYGSTSPLIKPPAYQAYSMGQPIQLDQKMSTKVSTDTSTTQPEKTGTTDKQDVGSNVGMIEDGKVQLNGSENTHDIENDSYSTEEETFYEINQMPWTAKSTEQLNKTGPGLRLAAETINYDTEGCSSGEDIFFDADRMTEEGKLFNPRSDRLN